MYVRGSAYTSGQADAALNLELRCLPALMPARFGSAVVRLRLHPAPSLRRRPYGTPVTAHARTHHRCTNSRQTLGCSCCVR